MLDVNLESMMLTSKYAIPEMIEGGGGDLRHDDGADDVDRIGRLQVLDVRAQELVRSAHDRVVDGESRCAIVSVQRGQAGP